MLERGYEKDGDGQTLPLKESVESIDKNKQLDESKELSEIKVSSDKNKQGRPIKNVNNLEKDGSKKNSRKANPLDKYVIFEGDKRLTRSQSITRFGHQQSITPFDPIHRLQRSPIKQMASSSSDVDNEKLEIHPISASRLTDVSTDGSSNNGMIVIGQGNTQDSENLEKIPVSTVISETANHSTMTDDLLTETMNSQLLSEKVDQISLEMTNKFQLLNKKLQATNEINERYMNKLTEMIIEECKKHELLQVKQNALFLTTINRLNEEIQELREKVNCTNKASACECYAQRNEVPTHMKPNIPTPPTGFKESEVLNVLSEDTAVTNMNVDGLGSNTIPDHINNTNNSNIGNVSVDRLSDISSNTSEYSANNNMDSAIQELLSESRAFVDKNNAEKTWQQVRKKSQAKKISPRNKGSEEPPRGTNAQQPSISSNNIRETSSPSPKAISRFELADEINERRLRKKQFCLSGNIPISWWNKHELSRGLGEIPGIYFEALEVWGNDNMLFFEIGSFDKKVNIMRLKHRLKGRNLWLKDNLTEREEIVLKWLRKEANNIRASGKNVKVYYMKLQIDGSIHKWNDLTDVLQHLPFREGKESARWF